MPSPDVKNLRHFTDNHWSPIRLIATGSFGSVFEIVARQNQLNINVGTRMAAKIITVKKNDSKKKSTDIELKINQILIAEEDKSPFILICTDIFTTTHKDIKRIYLIMPRGRGCLYDILDEEAPTGFNQDEGRWLIECLANGIQHLHQLNIVHLDLKPDNVLIFDNPEVNQQHSEQRFHPKICDFSNSEILKHPHSPINRIKSTIGYGSPESLLLRNNSFDGFGQDVYSLGCVLVKMLTNRSMFKIDMTYKDLYCRESLKFVRKQQSDEKVSMLIDKRFDDPILKDLLRKTLAEDARQRLSVKEFLEHPWIKREVITNSDDDNGITQQPAAFALLASRVPNIDDNYEVVCNKDVAIEIKNEENAANNQGKTVVNKKLKPKLNCLCFGCKKLKRGVVKWLDWCQRLV